MPGNPTPISSPYQLVLEGQDDCDFFSRLVRDCQLNGYQAGCGRGDDGRCLGKDGFGKRLEAIRDFSTVATKGYVIVADSDDDPADRFKKACGHLKKYKLPVPDSALKVATDNSGVRTAVIMLPSEGTHGGLETILVGCCDGLGEKRDCVDAFFNCGTVGTSRILDRDKFKLRALVAVHNPSDPSMTTGYWLSEATRPFAMNHPTLQWLIDFLRSFAV
jgi:hypothetical protein